MMLSPFHGHEKAVTSSFQPISRYDNAGLEADLALAAGRLQDGANVFSVQLGFERIEVIPAIDGYLHLNVSASFCRALGGRDDLQSCYSWLLRTPETRRWFALEIVQRTAP